MQVPRADSHPFPDLLIHISDKYHVFEVSFVEGCSFQIASLRAHPGLPGHGGPRLRRPRPARAGPQRAVSGVSNGVPGFASPDRRPSGVTGAFCIVF